MRYLPGNAQYLGARENQQDAFAFSDLEDERFIGHGGVVAVVADGMGGLAEGVAASSTAVRAFLEQYLRKLPEQSIPDTLFAAVRAANDAVVNLAREAGRVEDVGTTLAAAVVDAGTLHWVSVGDSHVYLWRNRRLLQVNTDHVYGTELDQQVARGSISAEDALHDPDREALTSHLGMRELRAIDRSLRPFPLHTGDKVVVCSDGLYRALQPDEIARVLEQEPQRACEELVANVAARALPQQDNVTVLALATDGRSKATGAEARVDPASGEDRPPADPTRKRSSRFFIWCGIGVLSLAALSGALFFWNARSRSSRETATPAQSVNQSRPDQAGQTSREQQLDRERQPAQPDEANAPGPR